MISRITLQSNSQREQIYLLTLLLDFEKTVG